MSKPAASKPDRPRAATGHYPFLEHRSVSEIDTGRQGLTPRAATLLAYLRSRETTPSFEEMARAIGNCSKGFITVLVKQLLERGFITASFGAGGWVMPYSIRVVEKKVNLGSVATPDLIAELERRGLFIARAA